jgi:hypothetical protein
MLVADSSFGISLSFLKLSVVAITHRATARYTTMKAGDKTEVEGQHADQYRAIDLALLAIFEGAGSPLKRTLI